MQKFWNIASVIIILGLGVWIYFIIQANSKYKQLIGKRIVITPESQPTPATPEQTIPEAEKTISGAQLWSAFQKKVSEMTVDLKFNNNK